MQNIPAMKLHPADSVAIALRDLVAGGELPEFGVTLRDDIPAGHKFSLRALAAGEPVLKYGQFIGRTKAAVPAGGHVHVHNIVMDGDSTAPRLVPAAGVSGTATAARSFDGYLRENGSTGTRNYIGIVSSVNCSATVVRRIAESATAAFPGGLANVDGVCPVTHTTGCGIDRGGEGFELLRRTLAGYIGHPNMGGVLVIGLGCEANDVAGLLQSAGLQESDTLRTMTIQGAGGTRAAIESGTRTVCELMEAANSAGRQAIPASELKLGLQCGGSDAFSGVTANPALGVAADRLVEAGGTVILGETPEIYGAEHLLLARAASEAVADALNDRLDWWKSYVAMHGASLDNNPSPGNIAGGITNILEKSLGAVMKSGTSPLQGVYRYAEKIDQRGFVFMDSPGYDPCSITGEIASGANLVCFTTGRGSVFGAKPAPSIKLSTNSKTAAHMAEDIDLDCGRILTGERTVTEAGDDIFELLIETASGRRSASEVNGLGDMEFVPWQLGAVL